jgi:hypothetical protein
MTLKTKFTKFARIAKDFLLGASLFALATLAFSGESPDIAWTLEPVYRDTGRPAAIVILGLVFSSIVVVNLWFYRHLRRAYTSPRRGRRRG